MFAAGHWSEANATGQAGRNVPHAGVPQRPAPARARPIDAMEHRLCTHEGPALYAKRSTIVEARASPGVPTRPVSRWLERAPSHVLAGMCTKRTNAIGRTPHLYAPRRTTAPFQANAPLGRSHLYVPSKCWSGRGPCRRRAEPPEPPPTQPRASPPTQPRASPPTPAAPCRNPSQGYYAPLSRGSPGCSRWVRRLVP